MGNRILVIGNGFDVAHNLDTKYIDFINFIQRFKGWFEKREQTYDNAMLLSSGRWDHEFIDHLLYGDARLGEYLYSLINENIWLLYFDEKNYSELQWIDFEAEIEKVIMAFDSDLAGEDISKPIEHLSINFFQKFLNEKLKEMEKLTIGKPSYSFKSLLGCLKVDARDLSKALEIYLYGVQMFELEHRIRKRLSTGATIDTLKRYGDFFDFEKVISFNYTDTCRMLYDRNEQAEYCYVHGRIRDSIHGENAAKNAGGIVIGIPDEDDNVIFHAKERNYHEFEKFTLRERYGCKKYADWIREIDNGDVNYEMYVIGHSLPYADKDIIINYLLSDRIKTIVFYYDDDSDAHEKLQNNLIQMIGKNEYKVRSNTSIIFEPVSSLAP